MFLEMATHPTFRTTAYCTKNAWLACITNLSRPTLQHGDRIFLKYNVQSTLPLDHNRETCHEVILHRDQVDGCTLSTSRGDRERGPEGTLVYEISSHRPAFESISRWLKSNLLTTKSFYLFILFTDFSRYK